MPNELPVGDEAHFTVTKTLASGSDNARVLVVSEILTHGGVWAVHALQPLRTMEWLHCVCAKLWLLEGSYFKKE